MPIDRVAVGADELVRRVARVGGDDHRALRLDLRRDELRRRRCRLPLELRRDARRTATDDPASAATTATTRAAAERNAVMLHGRPPRRRGDRSGALAYAPCALSRAPPRRAPSAAAGRSRRARCRRARACAGCRRASRPSGARRAARSGCPAGRSRATRRRCGRPPAAAATTSWAPRNASRGVITSSPHGGAGAKRTVAPSAREPGVRPRPRAARRRSGRRAASPARPCRRRRRSRSAPASSRLMSALSRSASRQLVAVDREPAHVDREPQRVVAEHAGAPDEALVEHVEAGDLADLGARAVDGARRSRAISSRPCVAARRRAASSDAVSSEFGLVDSVSVTVRSTIVRVERGRRRGGASPTGRGCRRSCACSRSRGRRRRRARARAAPR